MSVFIKLRTTLNNGKWFQTFVKLVVSVLMTGLFLNSLIYGIKKYQSEPTATTITKTIGDNEKGIKFPQMRICDKDFVFRNRILNQCWNDSSTYLYHPFKESLKNCLNIKDYNFTLETFRKSIQFITSR